MWHILTLGNHKIKLSTVFPHVSFSTKFLPPLESLSHESSSWFPTCLLARAIYTVGADCDRARVRISTQEAGTPRSNHRLSRNIIHLKAEPSAACSGLPHRIARAAGFGNKTRIWLYTFIPAPRPSLLVSSRRRSASARFKLGWRRTDTSRTTPTSGAMPPG